jgi:RNA polymerase sigma-70 factor (ECF subfamily)
MRDTNLLDERQLMRDYGRGDPAAVRLVDQWIDAALRQGSYSLRAEWDDLRQEIRMRLLLNLENDRFAARSSLKTYVYRITRNVCVDRWRQVRRRDREVSSQPERATSAPGTGSGLSAHIARDLVDKLMGRLTESERLLVEMVFGENCSYSEVAQRLGISEATVKTRVFRCKGRIVKFYERLDRRGR